MSFFAHIDETLATRHGRRVFNEQEAESTKCPECGAEDPADCDCFDDACPPGTRPSFDCACGRCASVWVGGPR